jgi:hypothetical protein
MSQTRLDPGVNPCGTAGERRWESLLARRRQRSTRGKVLSHFPNAPFEIDSYIPSEARTCPPSGGPSTAFGLRDGGGQPGGCTADLVHRFYQEQYQLNQGQQNRYVTGSDAAGLAMGLYKTTDLPIYKYLHAPGHPRYALLDRFFQAAFGGSFINHHWLIAARTPTFDQAIDDGSGSDLHSVVDANGMPVKSYPLYAARDGVQPLDQALTASCKPGGQRSPTPRWVLCGDYAVNTIQPAFQPFFPGTPVEAPPPGRTTASVPAPASPRWSFHRISRAPS